jgi:hypothetical protein
MAGDSVARKQHACKVWRQAPHGKAIIQKNNRPEGSTVGPVTATYSGFDPGNDAAPNVGDGSVEDQFAR